MKATIIKLTGETGLLKPGTLVDWPEEKIKRLKKFLKVSRKKKDKEKKFEIETKEKK